MKKELGITKGEWMITEMLSPINHDSAIGSISIGLNDDSRNWIAEAKGSHVNYGISYTELYANAKLIAEAGTVANETGKTPRQLADDNKVLLDALKEVRGHMTAHITERVFDLIDSVIKQVIE